MARLAGHPGDLGLSALSLVAFVLHERRAPGRSSVAYFGKRNFVFPLEQRALANFAYMGGFFLFPILVGAFYGFSETKAGLISTARPLMFSLVAPAAGYAAVKVERWSVVAGSTVLTSSMIVFTRLRPRTVDTAAGRARPSSRASASGLTPSTASSSSNEVAADDFGVMSAAQLLHHQDQSITGVDGGDRVQAAANGGAGDLSSFQASYAVGAVAAVIATMLASSSGIRHGRAGAPPRRRPHPADLVVGRGVAERGRRRRSYSVIAWMRMPISTVAASGVRDCSSNSLAMSPSTLIFPA